MCKKTYYITTPIYYPSTKLHIGNTYTTVAADALARYKRLTGYDVMFLTGTDEHGQKIQRIAEEKGITPKAHVDEIVAGIKDLWKMMNISYDKFIRTTDDYHIKAVQDIFKKLYDKVSSGEGVAVYDKALLDDDGKLNLQMFNQNLKNTYIAGDILSDLRKYKDEFLTIIGINNANTDKKERLITDEVNANNQETHCLADLWLEQLKECCTKVNDMFDIGISVDWRYKESEVISNEGNNIFTRSL